MHNEKITIIVPIYNVEQYIEKCLNSLSAQSYENIEIIAVNDGSSDTSAEVVKKCQKSDKRIKLVEKENGGYGSVLEYAIKSIETKYFLICDPDDWLSEKCIEKLYMLAEENDLDITIGNKILSYNDGTQILDNMKNEFYILNSNEIYNKEDIEKFAFLPPSPHAKLYKTRVAKNIIFPHKVSYTDFLLYLVALKNSSKAMYIEEPLAYYLLERPGNTRMDRKPKAIKDHLIVWNSIFDQIEKKDKYIIYRLYKELKYITKIYYRNSVNLFKDDAFDELIKAVERIKVYYNDIEKNFTKKIINKIELFFICNSRISLKIFIGIRRIFNR